LTQSIRGATGEIRNTNRNKLNSFFNYLLFGSNQYCTVIFHLFDNMHALLSTSSDVNPTNPTPSKGQTSDMNPSLPTTGHMISYPNLP